MVGIDGFKKFFYLFVGAETESAQQRRNRRFALAVNLHPDHVRLVGFHFQPRAAVRNYLRAVVVRRGTFLA